MLHPSREAIGARLQIERKRVGLNQDEFAQRVGVAKRTLAGYEAGNADVGASVLALSANIGVDVLYVVTGERKLQPIDGMDGSETQLVENYRQLSEEDRNYTSRVVAAMVEMAKRDEFHKTLS
ncbi:XRE family transcriptional regulator [Pseudomonas aeruginosa]|nr:XRE family transcriptional regulator [Pseudomonas aeruginosa]TEC90335.1 XRE family transcriptional regulator [Pseudomonas aeruginosa]